MDDRCKSISGVDNYDGVCCSSRTYESAPLFDRFRSTADVTPAETVASPAVKGADMAAFGIDRLQARRFTEPVRADADAFVYSCTRYSTAVEPPAVTA